MITNKDIRVENGNIVINGDKYPLASQAEIDAVKGDIGDLTQTGITGATVAAQLAAVNNVKCLPVVELNYTCSSTNFEYTGVNISCPASHTYIVCARISYIKTVPTGILASSSDSLTYSYLTYAYNENASYITIMLTAGQTAYIWGKWNGIGQNAVRYWIVDITN